MVKNIQFLGYVNFEEYGLIQQFSSDDEIITPTEQANFTADDFGNILYQAPAKNKQGIEYMIEWEITHPDFDNLEDEELACDWTQPSKIYKV